MKTSDFDYALPPELIAQRPIEPRDASRMLVLDRRTDSISHRSFRDVHDYLRPGDLLVANNSRVIPARLRGIKETGGAVEILLLRPEHSGGATGEEPPGLGHDVMGHVPGAASAWQCLVGGKGLRPGVRVSLLSRGTPRAIRATILAESDSGARMVAFDPPVESWLWEAGEIPLPPYIHHPLSDPERYQTVYGRIEGSAASSTAGLHFTPALLLELRERGVKMVFVTLHIGLDTFRPVQVAEIEEHRIHREWARLSAEVARTVNRTRLEGGRIVAVGTTVVRVLESAAKIALGYNPCDDVPVETTCGWQTVTAFAGETDLFIRPGHHFRAVDAMITNFHLPRSTLLMLVSAFAGREFIRRAYDEAIQHRYRFYSFGDAMMIL